MIKASAGPTQPKKHTPPKWVCQIYETYNTNTEPLKPNSLKK